MALQHSLDDPGNIIFWEGGRPILVITPAGQVVRGQAFPTDAETAVALFERLCLALPPYVGALLQRVAEAEAEVARLKRLMH